MQTAIRETQAETIFVTHGFIPELVRWLNESGMNAKPLQTQFVGEEDALDDVLATDFFEKGVENQ